MATTTDMLIAWFKEGVRKECTHMIVVCDTFDWEDYPVYVGRLENAREMAKDYDGKNMQRVMEVYDLRKPMEPQMKPGTRVFNY